MVRLHPVVCVMLARLGRRRRSSIISLVISSSLLTLDRYLYLHIEQRLEFDDSFVRNHLL